MKNLLRYSAIAFIPLGFNTPPLWAGKIWGCGGFVPPQTQGFQGEIFNTPPLCGGDYLFSYYLLSKFFFEKVNIFLFFSWQFEIIKLYLNISNRRFNYGSR
jgi:hypothetical protein